VKLEADIRYPGRDSNRIQA